MSIASTPLVAIYLPPLEAAALLLPILLIQDAISVYVYRRDWDTWNLKVTLPGAAVGLAFGWLLASRLPDEAVRILIGVIGVSFVANTWLQRGNIEPQQKTAASGFLWGGVSGFTSFVTQGGAPPFQIHVLPQRLPKMTFVGTATLFFAAVNVMKIAPYFLLGQFSARNLATSIILLPIAIAANFAGIWTVRKLSTGVFYTLAHVLLLMVSLVLLWQGASTMI